MDPLIASLRFAFAASGQSPQDFLAWLLAGFVGCAPGEIHLNGLDVTRDELLAAWGMATDPESMAAMARGLVQAGIEQLEEARLCLPAATEEA